VPQPLGGEKEGLVDVTPETWQDKRFEPAYKWHRWRIGAPSAEEPHQTPSVEGSEFRVVDGKVLSFANNAEYSETTLIELDDEGRQPVQGSSCRAGSSTWCARTSAASHSGADDFASASNASNGAKPWSGRQATPARRCRTCSGTMRDVFSS
jgi:hypothetical protein